MPCLALPCLALSWWARRPSSPHCLASSHLDESRIRRAPRRQRDPYALPCSHSRHNAAYYTASTRRFSFLAPHRVACLAVCARARHQRVVPVVNRTAGPPRSRRHARTHASREAGTNSVRRLFSAIGRPGARWLGARSGRFVLNRLFFGTADRGRDAMRRLTAVEALYFCEHIRDLAVCSIDVSVPLLIRWLGIPTFFSSFVGVSPRYGII